MFVHNIVLYLTFPQSFDWTPVSHHEAGSSESLEILPPDRMEYCWQIIDLQIIYMCTHLLLSAEETEQRGSAWKFAGNQSCVMTYREHTIRLKAGGGTDSLQFWGTISLSIFMPSRGLWDPVNEWPCPPLLPYVQGGPSEWDIGLSLRHHLLTLFTFSLSVQHLCLSVSMSLKVCNWDHLENPWQ